MECNLQTVSKYICGRLFRNKNVAWKIQLGYFPWNSVFPKRTAVPHKKTIVLFQILSSLQACTEPILSTFIGTYSNWKSIRLTSLFQSVWKAKKKKELCRHIDISFLALASGLFSLYEVTQASFRNRSWIDKILPWKLAVCNKDRYW